MAQAQGDVGQQGARTDLVRDANDVAATAADLGLNRREIHEARLLRDAEAADPGLVRRTLDERLARGEEPMRAWSCRSRWMRWSLGPTSVRPDAT